MTEQEALDVEVAEFRARCSEARADGLAALTALANVQACLESLDAMETTDNPLLKSALLIGLTIAYYRGFEEITEEATNIKRRFSFRSVQGANKNLHLDLLKFRGDYLAHAKQDVNDFELSFIKQTMTTTPFDGSPPHKVITGGSQARASMPMIPQGDATAALREHLTAIKAAAADQLGRALFKHENAMVMRLRLGDKPDVKFTHKGDLVHPPGTGTAVSTRPEAHIVRASAPEALGAEFTTLRYWLVMNDDDVMEMVETLTGGNTPGVEPAVKILRPVAVDSDEQTPRGLR
jgi:hypothetical protein